MNRNHGYYVITDERYSRDACVVTQDQFEAMCNEQGWPVDESALTPLSDYIAENGIEIARTAARQSGRDLDDEGFIMLQPYTHRIEYDARGQYSVARLSDGTIVAEHFNSEGWSPRRQSCYIVAEKDIDAEAEAINIAYDYEQSEG